MHVVDAVVQVAPVGLMVTTYTTDPAGAVAGQLIVIDLDVDDVVAVAGATSSGTVVVVGGTVDVVVVTTVVGGAVVATPDTPATRVFGATAPWPTPFVAVTRRPLVPSRLTSAFSHVGSRPARTTLGAYVALTKPRIIELLLANTFFLKINLKLA